MESFSKEHTQKGVWIVTFAIIGILGASCRGMHHSTVQIQCLDCILHHRIAVYTHSIIIPMQVYLAEK